jgi:hypothetical protein
LGSESLLSLLEAVVKVAKVAIFAALFEIIKVIPKVVVPVFFACGNSTIRPWKART